MHLRRRCLVKVRRGSVVQDHFGSPEDIENHDEHFPVHYPECKRHLLEVPLLRKISLHRICYEQMRVGLLPEI